MSWHAQKNQDFVAEYERLSGVKLTDSRTPLERAIDDACKCNVVNHPPAKASGFPHPDNVMNEKYEAFLEFVYDCVYSPLLLQQEQ